MPEIDYWDEDFDAEDIADFDDLGELEGMEADLQCEVANSEERITSFKANINVIQERIKKLKS